MPPKHYKYKAFISYSHQDKKWGDWLHRAQEDSLPQVVIRLLLSHPSLP